jgi:hypothetical protein
MNCSTAMEHSCRIYRQHAGVTGREEISADVRFGSKADIRGAATHVRFTPNSDRESGFPQTVMSALRPKSDMCGATTDVRFGPIGDIPSVDYLLAVSRARKISW